LILDSSAIVSVVREEVGHERVRDALQRADRIAIGTPTLFETAMVAIGRFGDEDLALVIRFLDEWAVEVVDFDERHWGVAADAFIRFGKGRHPARLNYGDCMTYAMARVAGAPLLFVGGDFACTDLAVA
jgi:ribonuclease VapC